ncbi:NADP-dependent oxidoreductase domain-containing protein [Lipomyces oligophaga]|uniref:NADP-dependent oxidoreductase domain-containing protein n=1 Tax=Lipomyces oligophaga TaxID=45792 RepID=UPI0034CFE69A
MPEKSFDVLDAFTRAGGNFIDTANAYQFEQSETWIGEWMKERNNRDLMVVATKHTSQYRSHELGNHLKSMNLSLRDSLRKLQTDYVDILYVHLWDYTTSIKELMDRLHMLVLQGKVLYLGISDAPAWVDSAANTCDFDRDILLMARHFGLALAPLDVVGGGRFKTKKQLEKRMKSGDLRFRASESASASLTPQEEKMNEVLSVVAEEAGTESLAAIAIAYVMAKATNVFPILGMRSNEQMNDNIAALSIKLTNEQIKYLQSVNEFDIGFPTTMIGEDPHVTGEASMFVSSTAPMAFTKLYEPISIADQNED